MPSPFPGIGPYLEAPGIRPGFCNRLAVGIGRELDRVLPAPHHADIEERAELGIIGEPGGAQPIVPDVVIARHPVAPTRVAEGGVAGASRTRREVSPHVEFRVATEPIRDLVVEIRDPTRGHKVITLIEIVSPSSKRAGPDRDADEGNHHRTFPGESQHAPMTIVKEWGLAGPQRIE